MEQDNTDLRDKLHELREEKAHLISENHNLLNEVEKLQYELHHGASRLRLLEDDAEKYRLRADELNNALLEVEKTNELRVSEWKKLNENYETCNLQLVKLDDIIQRQQKTISSYEKQISSLSEEKRKADDSRDVALDAAEEMHRHFGEYQNQLQSRLDFTESKLSASYEEREKLLADLVQRCLENESLQNQIEHLQAQISTERNQLQTSEDKNSKLSQHLETYCAQIEALQLERESCISLKAENLKLEGELNRKSMIISSLEAAQKENQSNLVELESLSQLLMNNAMKHLNFSEARSGTDASHRLLQRQGDLRPMPTVAENDFLMKYRCTCIPGERLGCCEGCRAIKDESGVNNKALVELKLMVHHLSEEKHKQMAVIRRLEQKISDFKVEKAALDSQLTGQNTRTCQLEEQLAKSTVDKREMERSLFQIATLEKQLDEKTNQMTSLLCRETDLRSKLEYLQKLEEEMKAKTEIMLCENQTMRQNSEKLQSQLQRTEDQNNVLRNQLIDADKRNLSMQSTFGELNSAVDCLRQELQFSSRQLRDQKTQSVKNLLEMGTTVEVLKKDLMSTVAKLKSIEKHHCRDLGEVARQVSALEGEMQRMIKTHEHRVDRVKTLERELREKEELISRHSTEMEQLENLRETLTREKKESEQDHCQAVADLRSSLESCECRLKAATEDVGRRELQIGELTKAVQSLQLERKRIIGELGDDLKVTLEELKSEKQENRKLSSDVLALRREIERLSDSLQQRENCVEELNQRLSRSDLEVQEKSLALQVAFSEHERLKLEVEQGHVQLAESESNLNCKEADLQQCTQQLDVLKDELKRREDELNGHRGEVDELRHELERQQWDVQQKMSHLAESDHDAKERMAESEQRAAHLEGLLEQFQTDYHQLQKQASAQSMQLKNLKSVLCEKSFLLHELEQVIKQLNGDLDAERERSAIQEKMIEGLQIEKRNLELISGKGDDQLERSKEQIREIQERLDHSEQKLATTECEFDRSTKALADCQKSFQVQTSELEKLAVALTRSDENRSTLIEQLRHLKKEHELMKEQLNDELLNLRNSRVAEMSTVSEERGIIEEKLRAADERQLQLSDKLKRSDQEVSSLHMQLDAVRMIANAMKETSVIKDAEIARLKARLNGINRSQLNTMGLKDGAEHPFSQMVNSNAFSVDRKSSEQLCEGLEMSSGSIVSRDQIANRLAAFEDPEKTKADTFHISALETNWNNNRNDASAAVSEANFVSKIGKSIHYNDNIQAHEAESDSPLTMQMMFNDHPDDTDVECHQTNLYPVPLHVSNSVSDCVGRRPQRLDRVQVKARTVNTLTGTSDPKRYKSADIQLDKHRFGRISEERQQIQNRIKALIGYKGPSKQEIARRSEVLESETDSRSLQSTDIKPANSSS